MKASLLETITYRDNGITRQGAFMGFGRRDLRLISHGSIEEVDSLPELATAYVWVWPLEDGCENLIGVPPEWVID